MDFQALIVKFIYVYQQIEGYKREMDYDTGYSYQSWACLQDGKRGGM